MAKIIKFALELKDGESARTIEDLRQHFDLEKVVAYFMNGRLLTWLKHRHFDEEAAALEKLSAEDTGFARKLCDILGVAYEEHQEQADTIDANALMADHERLNRLRQVTTDPEILAKVDRVAFDEKDLRRLAFDHEPEVYLCNGRFVIPLNVPNKHYIGLGKAEAMVGSSSLGIEDLKEEKGIRFTNVSFDEAYQKVIWYRRGVWAGGRDKNFDDEIMWFQKAAAAGSGSAMCALGQLYCKDYYSEVPNDYGKAVEWFKKGADIGSADCIIEMGICYYTGKGVPQDYNESEKWFRKIVDSGNAKDICLLGEYTRDDLYNCEKAAEYFRIAARAGYGGAMCELGALYYYGFDIPKDYGKAVKWFKKGADVGDLSAIFHMGICYYTGKGVPQDYDESEKCFQKIVDSGDGSKIAQIGDYFWDGLGSDDEYVSKNPEKAAEYYRIAAMAGNAHAMYALGRLYSEDDGIEKDVNQARKWMEKAAAAGYKYAKEWLQEH